MSEGWSTLRIAGTTTAGSRFPERPACGASRRERMPNAAHDTP